MSCKPGPEPLEDQVLLALGWHPRLAGKPVRTLEVLRAFLLHEAEAAYEAFLRGQWLEVQRGPRSSIAWLASALQAQGFRVAVRAPDAGPADA